MSSSSTLDDDNDDVGGVSNFDDNSSGLKHLEEKNVWIRDFLLGALCSQRWG